MISHKSGGVPGTFDHGERASSHEDYIMESEAKKCAFLDFFFSQINYAGICLR